MFSDKLTFTIDNHAGRSYVRRRPEEGYRSYCILPTVNHLQPMMVWDCMAVNGIDKLELVSKIIYATNYIDEPSLCRVLTIKHSAFDLILCFRIANLFVSFCTCCVKHCAAMHSHTTNFITGAAVGVGRLREETFTCLLVFANKFPLCHLFEIPDDTNLLDLFGTVGISNK